MKYRKFTSEKKLEILQYGQDHGVMEACRQYGIANSLYYKWKAKFDVEGIDGLRLKYKKRQDSEVSALQGENALLKKLLAEKEMELSLAKEMIKKKYRTK